MASKFHVWQATTAGPSLTVQYVAPEVGTNRPDGAAWTDPYVMPFRASTVTLTHAGMVSGVDLGPFGLDPTTQSQIMAMAPAGTPVQTTVVATFGD